MPQRAALIRRLPTTPSALGELRREREAEDDAEIEDGAGDEADGRQRELELTDEVGDDRADVAGTPGTADREQGDRQGVTALEGRCHRQPGPYPAGMSASLSG